MSLISESLSFVTEHVGGQRCEVVRNQALSSQFFIALLRIVAKSGLPGQLLNLRMRFSANILDQIFERVWTYSQHTSMPQKLALAGLNASHLWFHISFESLSQMLVTAWAWGLRGDDRLDLRLERVYHLGQCERDPLDLCRDHLVCLEHAFLKCGHQPLSLEVDHRRLAICLNIQEWAMKLIVASDNRLAPFVSTGKTSILVEENTFWLEYDAGDISEPSEATLAQGCEGCEGMHEAFLTPEVIILGKPSADEDWGLKPNAARNAALPAISRDLRTSLVRLHETIAAHQKLTPEVISEVLERAERDLPYEVFCALLYMVHVWAPELSEAIKLRVLTLASSEHASALILSILVDIYRREQSDTLLLTLLQRQLNGSTFCPHRLIRLGLEMVETLSGSLMMYAMAIRRLDAMKSLVLQHGSVRELIAFALGYHHAQYSGMAIQCLKQWMKQAVCPGDIAAFGFELAKVMLEHNEPMQRIIDVCTRVLAADPMHSATLEILAQCLEDSDRPEEAAEIWHHCFGCLIQAWELSRTRFAAMPTPENRALLSESHARALRTAENLERLLSGMERAPQRCLIYRDHLRLEPNAMHVLARYLKDLESMRYFHEMAQCCEAFLAINAVQLSANDEISIRLTLHNIYDRELHRESEAMKHLARARQIGALDPRVIGTEVDRCRRRGQKQEQIELMIAWIDALPASECVEPTLELVRLYESVQADMGLIAEVLRKANGRYPNQAPILLELRHYLRKMGQSFELASVLEKLAKVTTDLQTRRSILLEASEVQERLGNHQIAQSLYHEAQLCSPINPVGKAEIPNTLRLGYGEMSAGLSYAAPISRLASVVLTSRSVSAVDQVVDSLEPEEHTHSGLGGLSVHSERAESDHIWSGISDWGSISSSALSLLAGDLNGLSASSSSESNVSSTGENMVSDSQGSVETQILSARQKGNTKALLERLLRLIESLPESEQPPRVLQEIGCIYLYENHDLDTAKSYLERACCLSSEVANGEQTLNALEEIYYHLKEYHQLAEIYEKKSHILTIAEEKRKYEIRLAQVRYEHLQETGLAIETLKRMLSHHPVNESALQLLAQIYLETQQVDLALETLEQVSESLKPHSKALSQHLLRLSGIYIEHDRREEAKRVLRRMLNQREYVDKLAVLEQYKGLCRAHDEWPELAELLREELALHLQMPVEKTEIETIIDHFKNKQTFGHVAHTLREYADILFYKIQDVETALKIYSLLYRANPDDSYFIDVFVEIIEQSSDVYQMLTKIFNLLALDTEQAQGVDQDVICRSLCDLYIHRESSWTEDWQAQMYALKAQIKSTPYAKFCVSLLEVFRNAHEAY